MSISAKICAAFVKNFCQTQNLNAMDLFGRKMALRLGKPHSVHPTCHKGNALVVPSMETYLLLFQNTTKLHQQPSAGNSIIKTSKEPFEQKYKLTKNATS